jgi:lipopolysaccharide export system permease protein
MQIVDRYLLRELFKILFAVLLILSFIIASLGLMKLLDKAAIGNLNPRIVMPLLGYQILRYLGRSMPPAFFIAVLATLGRLYRDNEMLAFSTCGISTARIYRSLSLSLIIMMPLTAWLTTLVQPWAAIQMEAVIAAQKQIAAELIGLKSGQFHEYSQGNMVFYIENIDTKAETMQNIFVQTRQHQKLGLVTANLGDHSYNPVTKDHFLTLHNGRRYEGNPGQANFTIAEFTAYTLRIAESPSKIRDLRAAKPTAQLYSSVDINDRAEFWERISYPISIFTLMLIAIPLSKSLPRQGLHGRLILAFLVYFSFLNMHSIAISWMRQQITAEWIGIWWVQAVLLLIASLILLFDSSWIKRLRSRFNKILQVQS